MSDINFYFSIGSTYTYLSVTRILDVEKNIALNSNGCLSVLERL